MNVMHVRTWIVCACTFVCAHDAPQDKKDDVQMGIRSTALRFGERTKHWLAAFGTGAVLSLGMAGMMNGQGAAYYAAVAGCAAHIAWQVRTVDLDRPTSCARVFRSNRRVGEMLTAGLLLDCAVAGLL